MANERDHEQESEVAEERIRKLFEQADNVFSEHPERAHRHIQRARKIAMKYKVGLTKEQKRKFCKHCYKYLKPGANCKVRTRKGKVIYHCQECGRKMRFPYESEQKQREDD